MGIVRNGIDIVGITPEKELPAEISGQLLEVSETENLLISKDVKIKKIQKIFLDPEIKGTKIINAPLCKIFIIDGYKKLKISYYDTENNMKTLELASPFNLFFDIEKNTAEAEELRLYIADAYFELTSSSTIYCYIIYMADIRYIKDGTEAKQKISLNKQNTGEFNLPKEAAALEMSISKEKKADPEKMPEGEAGLKNSLVDIEAEYL